MSRDLESWNDAEAMNKKGDELFFQDRYVEAEFCFRRAIELAPNNAEYRFGLAICLLRKDYHTEAEFCLRKAIELEPTNDFYQFQLGTYLVYQKCGVEAAACFRKALELKPNDILYEFHLEQVLFSQMKVYIMSSDWPKTKPLNSNPKKKFRKDIG